MFRPLRIAARDYDYKRVFPVKADAHNSDFINILSHSPHVILYMGTKRVLKVSNSFSFLRITHLYYAV